MIEIDNIIDARLNELNKIGADDGIIIILTNIDCISRWLIIKILQNYYMDLVKILVYNFSFHFVKDN